MPWAKALAFTHILDSVFLAWQLCRSCPRDKWSLCIPHSIETSRSEIGGLSSGKFSVGSAHFSFSPGLVLAPQGLEVVGGLNQDIGPLGHFV